MKENIQEMDSAFLGGSLRMTGCVLGPNLFEDHLSSLELACARFVLES